MMNLTFKEFLAEFTDPDLTPQEAAMKQRQAQQNPVRAARQEALKQKAESDVAQKDDALDPQKKRLEKDEADLARKKAVMAQRQQQQGDQ
jgi:hypothetical protein